MEKQEKNSLFIDSLAKYQKEMSEIGVTANGDKTYTTTKNPYLDFMFSLNMYRNQDVKTIESAFGKCIKSPADILIAIPFMFYIRDAREGIGERKAFIAMLDRVIREIHLMHFQAKVPAYVIADITFKLFDLVGEYGCYRDLFQLWETSQLHRNAICRYVMDTLKNDIHAAREGKPISLLAKWMPSITGVRRESISQAKYLARFMHITDKQYRKTLSSLRNYLNVVECNMSANEWGTINYETVPSKANIKYSSAFLRNDEDRRKEYLNSLKEGKAKINGAVNFPYDVVHKLGLDVNSGRFGRILPNYARISKETRTLINGLWKALPQYTEDAKGLNMLVVDDTSGSMFGTPHEVATSLAVYTSEQLTGPFKDKVILFSSTPRYIDLSNKGDVIDKICTLECFNECSNTDIEKTFDLILATAVENNLSQEDLPESVLIISDMQFDVATTCYSDPHCTVGPLSAVELSRKKFNDLGYQMPKLIFWNVDARPGGMVWDSNSNEYVPSPSIPIRQSDNGVIFVSGYSANTMKMLMSKQTDPMKALIEQLALPRYNKALLLAIDILEKAAPNKNKEK